MREREQTGRKRDAAATRLAILASARRAFANAGYDGAGVREIAANAGVTAMMVNHHFGSKEQLFEAVVAHAMETPTVMRHDVLVASDLATKLANAIVAGSSSASEPVEGFLIVLKSVANPRAAEICRQQIERYHHSWVVNVLSGENVAQRAGIILSLVAGVQFMRQSMQLSSLVEATPEALVQILRTTLAVLIDPGEASPTDSIGLSPPPGFPSER